MSNGIAVDRSVGSPFPILTFLFIAEPDKKSYGRFCSSTSLDCVSDMKPENEIWVKNK